jgi:cyclohexanecarboxylate-CoA ligase
MAQVRHRADADLYRERGWWRDQTVIDDLRRAVERHPDRAAVIAHHAGPGAAETLTFAELGGLVDRFAGALLELGVRPGHVVSIQLPNWWQLTALCLACARIGAVVNPIIPILRRREVQFMLERCESPVCVVPDVWRGFSHAGMMAEILPAVPTLRHVVVLGASSPAGAEARFDGAVDFERHFVRTPWEERHPAAELDALAPGPDELTQIMFTSGTTGEPKGVMHGHNTLYAATRAEAEALGLGGEDIVTIPSPMTHQAGFLYCYMMPMLLGATAVYLDRWDPGAMLDLIERHRITFVMGATTFVLDLVAAQRDRPRDLSTLRLFACGGSPIPPVLVEEARDVLGAELVALWGMTENGTTTITRPGDPPELVANSDGRPMPWMECKIVDELGRPCTGGEVGRLFVRGASQCAGYFKRPDLYAASLDGQGWFDTGDLAHSDGHGGIRIAGRAKDLIVRGGEKIPVVEVEAALYRHPGVREVAVVGVPDQRLGERACAIVVADGDPPTLQDVRDHLESIGMAKQFWPERVEVVDELPKTPSGKIQKFVLRERLRG